MLWELLLGTRLAMFERRTRHFPLAFIQSCIESSTGVKILKSSILIFLSLMSLSPVLRTLTAATSSDSIWALSAFLLALNALLADYTPMKLDKKEDSNR